MRTPYCHVLYCSAIPSAPSPQRGDGRDGPHQARSVSEGGGLGPPTEETFASATTSTMEFGSSVAKSGHRRPQAATMASSHRPRGLPMRLRRISRPTVKLASLYTAPLRMEIHRPRECAARARLGPKDPPLRCVAQDLGDTLFEEDLCLAPKPRPHIPLQPRCECATRPCVAPTPTPHRPLQPRCECATRRVRGAFGGYQNAFGAMHARSNAL